MTGGFSSESNSHPTPSNQSDVIPPGMFASPVYSNGYHSMPSYADPIQSTQPGAFPGHVPVIVPPGMSPYAIPGKYAQSSFFNGPRRCCFLPKPLSGSTISCVPSVWHLSTNYNSCPELLSVSLLRFSISHSTREEK